MTEDKQGSAHGGQSSEVKKTQRLLLKGDTAALLEIVMRYATEFYPNVKCMGVHCEKRLPKISWLGIGEKATPESEKLKEQLLAIPGVTEVTAYDYCLNVTRAGVFTWAEIEPQVLAVVREHFAVEELNPVPAFV